MIVGRYTYRTKVGCKHEYIQLLKAAVAELGLTPRVCSYHAGPQDIVESDLEFETEEIHQQWSSSFDASLPAVAEWLKRLPDLIESGTVREELEVH